MRITGKMDWYVSRDFETRKPAWPADALGFVKTVLSVSGDGILVTNESHTILSANRPFCEIFGRTPQDIVENPVFLDWLEEADSGKISEWLELADRIRREQICRGVEFRIAGNGVMRCFNVAGTLSDQTGSKTAVTVWRDVTVHKETSNKLKKIMNAETANREKDEFLTSMNHEVRTPMNGIIGMLDLALEGELSRDHREFLSLARCSAETLLNMLNNFFNFSKIKAGTLKIRHATFDIDSVLESVVSAFRMGAREKGLKIYHYLESDVPESLVGDPDRLRQILSNLLGNAVKFTDRGKILVRVSIDGNRKAASFDDSKPGTMLRFSVSDTGIGIPKAMHENIFESFVQADGKIRRGYGGIGLGLSISKQLVELMGGRIWLESEVGRGSVFHFTARLERHDATEYPLETEEADKGTEEKSGPRVLLAEDNESIRYLFMEFLGNEGCEVTAVTDGKNAVDAFENRTFDLVLMDIGLPVMDGFKASEAIREKGINIPIVALSGVCDLERIKKAGMTDYLSKPANRAQLLSVVEKHAPAEILKIVPMHEKITKDCPVEKKETEIAKFLELAGDEIPRLKSALKSKDSGRLERCAQKLKKAASDIGANSVSDESFRLVLAARKGDMKKSPILIEKIRKECENLGGS